MFDFFSDYIFTPPIEAHAELPFVDDISEFADNLIPDLSGNPMTWGPNFINWNLKNYVRILDNVFGYHNYNGDTQISIPETFYTAEAVYNYTFAGDTTTYTGTIYGYPATNQTAPFTVFNGPHFRVDIVSDSPPFQVITGFVTSGSYHGPTISGSGVSSPVLMIDEDYTTQTGTAVFRSNGNIPSYTAYTKPTIQTNTARLTTVGVTSNQAILAFYPKASFIKPDTYTYDSYKKQVIDNFNQSYPEATQNPDDFPTWQEILDEVHPEDATEPTEPSSGNGCCNIDYDEILSEGELESILNQEIYELAEIETIDSVFSLPEAPTYQLSEQIPDAVGFITSASVDLLSGLSLLPLFIGVAVIRFFFDKIL